MKNKIIYKLLSGMVIISLLVPNPVYAVVKDNVGGMDTGPAKGTKAITEETVLEDYSGWVNGKKIIGSMPNNSNTTITANNAFENTDNTYVDIQIPTTGYYDTHSYIKIGFKTLIKANSNLSEKQKYVDVINSKTGSNFTISNSDAELTSAILAIPTDTGIASGSVSYMYHHHDLTSTTDANSDNSLSGTYDDDYKAQTSGGCFTVPVFHKHSAECYTTTSRTIVHSSCTYHDNDGGVSCNICGWWECNGSGFYWTGQHSVTETISTLTCGKTEDTIEYYKCSCGYSEGQIVSATIVY